MVILADIIAFLFSSSVTIKNCFKCYTYINVYPHLKQSIFFTLNITVYDKIFYLPQSALAH